jgi:hypothetical protein
MNSDTDASRIAVLEAQVKQLKWLSWVGALALASVSLAAISGFVVAPRAKQRVDADTLRVHEVAIVDDEGVVRARLGGNLPDAVDRRGRRVPRGDKFAGLLIYDSVGAERGGYGTMQRSGSALLTLDTRGSQSVLLAADSSNGSGAVLRLWTDRAWAEVQAEAGGAHFATGRGGKIAYFQPPGTPEEERAFWREMDAELGALSKQPTPEELLSICERYRPQPTCRAHLRARVK